MTSDHAIRCDFSCIVMCFASAVQETQALYDLNVLRKKTGEPPSPTSSSSSGVSSML